MAPVGRHLAAAGRRVVLGAYTFEEHFVRRDAEDERERAITIVGISPIVAWLQREASSDEYPLVAGSADLEVNFVLALELDLPVVETTREEHRAVDANQGVAIKPVVFRGVRLRRFCFDWCRHSTSSREGRRFRA